MVGSAHYETYAIHTSCFGSLSFTSFRMLLNIEVKDYRGSDEVSLSISLVYIVVLSFSCTSVGCFS